MDVMTLAAKLTLNTSEFDSGLKQGEKEMKGLSSGGVAWGNLISRGVEKAGRALLNFGKQTVQVGMEFDAQMSQVKALGQMSDENFLSVRKRAMELGESTKFTAAQVGEAFSYMALAGWDTQEMLDGIDGVLSLAAASGEDLGRTSDIVTDAITAMGMTAKDSGHFVDVLAAASANSNTTVSQMGEAFKYLATTGGVLNYSIEDIATTLGLLANSGIKATQAGTSMRQILNTLINPTDKAAAAMETLGISLFDTTTNARKPLNQLLKEFRTTFKEAGLQMEEGFDPEELQSRIDVLNEWYDTESEKIEQMSSGRKKAQEELDKEYNKRLLEETMPNQAFLANLGDIGGLRGISSLFAIMASTDEDFEQLTNSIVNSEGAAQEMSKAMMDNLMGDITIMKSALEGLQIVVSDDFKGKLRSFVQAFTEEIGNLNEAFQQGGVLGMFTNLADWVINGITGALTNAQVTGEEAASFGEAIGDFVGRTITHLVEKAPDLISGLFKAGLNLAGGLIEGLFSGLFGTGEGTVTGLILNAQEEQQEAIDQAERSATEAQGILNYMDSLTKQYGTAAENTAEWAAALEQLKSVYPEINSYIAEEGGNLSATNASLMEYIENNKKRVEQEAQEKALQKYIDAYVQAESEKQTAQINMEIARWKQEQARQSLVDYIAGHEGQEGFTGKGMSIEQLEYAAGSVANEFGESQETIKNLVNVFNESKAAADANAAKINSLSEAADALKVEMDVASSALASFSGSLSSGGGGGTETYGQWIANQYAMGFRHAKGAWDVPYDDYPALLHRNETVLSASQARAYKEGQSMEMSSVINALQGLRNDLTNLQLVVGRKTFGRAVVNYGGNRMSDYIGGSESRLAAGYGT